MTWHVVFTRQRAEPAVSQALTRAGFDRLYLHYRATVRHARRTRHVLRPYYPRYLFVACDNGLISAVNYMPGVVELVHAGGKLLEVPHEVIEEQRGKGDETGLVHHVKLERQRERQRFEAGDTVKINGGVFEGFLAQVELDEGRQIRVWLEQLSGRVRATFPAEALSPVRRSFPNAQLEAV